MMKESYSRASAPSASVSTPGMSIAHSLENCNVVEVEYFVIETLQRSLWKRDQSHREFEAGEPRGGLNQMPQVFEIHRNVVAGMDFPDRRDQSDRSVRFDHMDSPIFGSSARASSIARVG